MKEMKIEWASANEIAKHSIDIAAYGEQPEPVVRLAAVDEVIAKAEMFAAKTLAMYRFAGLHEDSSMMTEVKDFLASDLVAQWRKRQEGKKS